MFAVLSALFVFINNLISAYCDVLRGKVVISMGDKCKGKKVGQNKQKKI